jgi:hypothetical protein
MIVAVIMLVALLAAMYAANRARNGHRHISKYEHCMNVFIAKAETILSDDETPEEIVSFLEFLRHQAVKPWAALQFMRHLFSRDRQQLRSTQLPSEFNDFIERRPELGRVLAEASVAAFLAMTYRGHLVGGLVRTLVFFDAGEHKDRTRDIAIQYQEVEKKIDPQKFEKELQTA